MRKNSQFLCEFKTLSFLMNFWHPKNPFVKMTLEVDFYDFIQNEKNLSCWVHKLLYGRN